MTDITNESETIAKYKRNYKEAEKFNNLFSGFALTLVPCLIMAVTHENNRLWLAGAIAVSVITIGCLIESRYYRLLIALHFLPYETKNQIDKD